ncbi:MAG TPA: winged helix-turn-helix domain-containing protein [Nitrososphaerales archaeon]|nr:winged helix-turn-helix domain-containing protein [Nitrososphaerales archaeon]
MAPKNRSRLEIVYDIISAARHPAKKTHLMYKSNLSFKQLDLYLSSLLENGLVEERFDEEEGRTYCVTRAGMNFIEIFERLEAFFTVPLSSESSRTASALARRNRRRGLMFSQPGVLPDPRYEEVVAEQKFSY